MSVARVAHWKRAKWKNTHQWEPAYAQVSATTNTTVNTWQTLIVTHTPHRKFNMHHTNSFAATCEHQHNLQTILATLRRRPWLNVITVFCVVYCVLCIWPICYCPYCVQFNSMSSAVTSQTVPTAYRVLKPETQIKTHNPNHKTYLNANMITHFTIHAKNYLRSVSTLVNVTMAYKSQHMQLFSDYLSGY
jgi:hypothetical protein